MITPIRLSYIVLAVTIALAGVLHLTAPLLVVLFSYFALRQLYFMTRRKWLALILFGVLVAGIAAAAIYFTRAAIHALPNVADTSIPSASAWAQKRQIELPFTDFESLKQAVIDTLGQEANYLRNVANFAKSATTTIVFSILGIVAAGSLFYKTGWIRIVARIASRTTSTRFAVTKFPRDSAIFIAASPRLWERS